MLQISAKSQKPLSVRVLRSANSSFSTNFSTELLKSCVRPARPEEECSDHPGGSGHASHPFSAQDFGASASRPKQPVVSRYFCFVAAGAGIGDAGAADVWPVGKPCACLAK